MGDVRQADGVHCELSASSLQLARNNSRSDGSVTNRESGQVRTVSVECLDCQAASDVGAIFGPTFQWMTFRKCFRARNTIWDTKLKPAIRGSDLSYHLPRFGITR